MLPFEGGSINEPLTKELENEEKEQDKEKNNLNKDIKVFEKEKKIEISKGQKEERKNVINANSINENVNQDLLLDVWENDNGEPKIDEKINIMLDKYFIKTNINKEKYKNKSDICEHLSIKYVEIKDYSNSCNCTYDKLNKDDENIERYERIDEKIKRANIYPNVPQENYILDPFKSGYFDFLQLGIFCFFYILLIVLHLSITKIIILIILYLLGIFIQIKFINFFNKNLWNLVQLKGENLKKLKKILNAKPYIDLYYQNNCIISIPFHSYSDISGISVKKNFFDSLDDETSIGFEKLNLENFAKINFPLKYLFFVDSTQQYFKFLITQFHKYCIVKNRSSSITEKMFIKYYLKTENDEIIYKNDPFFQTSFFTFKPRLYNIISILLLLTQSSTLFTLIANYFKSKIIEIKKTVSIMHNLEEYLKIENLFPRIILSNKKIRREKCEVINEKEIIKKQFNKICIDLTEKIKQEMKDDETKEKKPVINAVYNYEIKGYLTPFSSKYGFDSLIFYCDLEFQQTYGRKIPKIFKETNIPEFYSFQTGNEEGIKDILGHFKDNNYKEEDNENEIINDIKDEDNNIISTNYSKNEKKMRQVNYSERTLTLKCIIRKDSVEVNYNIKKSNGLNKTGKFTLYKKLSGFKELEEKVNSDWTKSEIYLPGCIDVIEIIRKKRAIKLSAKDFEIISDTKLNDDLHSGLPSWVNGDEWDQNTIRKCVKNCDKKSNINRFKVEYS